MPKSIYELLKNAIERQNIFMTPEFIQLQVEFFYTAGKVTQEQYDELIALLTPAV